MFAFPRLRDDLRAAVEENGERRKGDFDGKRQFYCRRRREKREILLESIEFHIPK